MLVELAVLAAIAVVVTLMYNSLVRLRETADGAWADIDVQLKRRHDLIPNLVETVKATRRVRSKRWSRPAPAP